MAQLTLFELIFRSVAGINDWSRYEYFAFMATGMLVNAIIEAFFMPNCANFSELIRTGNLDFVLLKPIDTQFLISFEKINLAMLNQVVLASCLLGYSITKMGISVTFGQVFFYLLLVGVAVAFFYRTHGLARRTRCSDLPRSKARRSLACRRAAVSRNTRRAPPNTEARTPRARSRASPPYSRV